MSRYFYGDKKILGWGNKKIGISLEFCRLGGGWVGGVGLTVRLFACWLGRSVGRSVGLLVCVLVTT